jgi:cytidine deaminase
MDNKLADYNLIKQAIEAREKSYSPYSNFAVGAALLTGENKIYKGCNVENSAYGPTNCAERTAIFSAISNGSKEFIKIAIVGGKNENDSNLCPPCGVCRQVLREFVEPKKFEIILSPLKSPKNITIYTLAQLLPLSFGPDNVNN